MRLLVPAYFYPGGDGAKHWERLLQSATATRAEAPAAPATKQARGARVTVIVNPASGPGEQRDPQYAAMLARAARANLELIGYVSTRYGKRPVEEIRADIRRWQTFYPQITGIFLDEQNSSVDFVKHYRQLYLFIHSQPGLTTVVTNPGVACDRKFFETRTSDTCCIHEQAGSLAKFQPPDWLRDFPPQRFNALFYNVRDEAEMRRCLAAAKAAGIGSIFVTDDQLPNPWDRMPDYWPAEIAETQ